MLCVEKVQIVVGRLVPVREEQVNNIAQSRATKLGMAADTSLGAWRMLS